MPSKEPYIYSKASAPREWDPATSFPAAAIVGFSTSTVATNATTAATATTATIIPSAATATVAASPPAQREGGGQTMGRGAAGGGQATHDMVKQRLRP